MIIILYHTSFYISLRPILFFSFAHDSGSDIPMEHDRSPSGQSGNRAAATRHIEQLHDWLHDRIFDRKLHVHTDCLQSAPETGLSPVPHVHPVRPDRRYVLDRLLDQAGSHPGAGHPWRDVTTDPRLGDLSFHCPWYNYSWYLRSR